MKIKKKKRHTKKQVAQWYKRICREELCCKPNKKAENKINNSARKIIRGIAARQRMIDEEAKMKADEEAERVASNPESGTGISGVFNPVRRMNQSILTRFLRMGGR